MFFNNTIQSYLLTKIQYFNLIYLPFIKTATDLNTCKMQEMNRCL